MKNIFLFLTLITISSAFAQESHFDISSTDEPVKVSTYEVNSKMNFILWFMGTREDFNIPVPLRSDFSKKECYNIW